MTSLHMDECLKLKNNGVVCALVEVIREDAKCPFCTVKVNHRYLPPEYFTKDSTHEGATGARRNSTTGKEAAARCELKISCVRDTFSDYPVKPEFQDEAVQSLELSLRKPVHFAISPAASRDVPTRIVRGNNRSSENDTGGPSKAGGTLLAAEETLLNEHEQGNQASQVPLREFHPQLGTFHRHVAQHLEEVALSSRLVSDTRDSSIHSARSFNSDIAALSEASSLADSSPLPDALLEDPIIPDSIPYHLFRAEHNV